MSAQAARKEDVMFAGYNMLSSEGLLDLLKIKMRENAALQEEILKLECRIADLEKENRQLSASLEEAVENSTHNAHIVDLLVKFRFGRHSEKSKYMAELNAEIEEQVASIAVTDMEHASEMAGITVEELKAELKIQDIPAAEPAENAADASAESSKKDSTPQEETVSSSTPDPAESNSPENKNPSGDAGKGPEKGKHPRRTKGSVDKKLANAQHIKCYTSFEDQEGLVNNPPLDSNGRPMKYVGEKFVGYRAVLIPARYVVFDVYQQKFRSEEKLPDPSGSSEKPSHFEWKNTPFPPALFRGGYLTPGMVSELICNKYGLVLPYYRMEPEWARRGIPIECNDVYVWTRRAFEEYLRPLVIRLLDEALSNTILQMDESRQMVMREPDRPNERMSYIWVCCTTKNAKHPVKVYQYYPGRSGDFPKELLEDSDVIYLFTDAFPGYNKVLGVIHCFCLIHARRKMVEALPSDTKLIPKSKAFDVILKFNEIFRIEATLQDLTAEERKEKRNELIKPLLDALYEHLVEISKTESAKSPLQKAIQYCMNNWTELTNFLQNGDIPLHNQVSELAFKRVALLRKNSLFYGSPAGAEVGCCMLTLIETAIANGLDPQSYIEHVLTEMQAHPDIKAEPEFLETVLPWSEQMKQTCQQLVDRKAHHSTVCGSELDAPIELV